MDMVLELRISADESTLPDEEALAGMQLKNLRSLTLTNCQMGPYGAKLLRQTLIERSVLKELVLAGNPLGRRGARQVALLIKNSLHLRLLDVSRCRIRNSGLSYLALATTGRHCNVRRLVVQENEID